jgi:hypothetical protein
MMGEAEPLLYSDTKLFDQLNVRMKAILSSPIPDNSEKVKFLCELAEKNFDGLRALVEKATLDSVN